MDKEKLEEILAKHQEWLRKGYGMRADFSGMDLSGISFAGMDLTEAFFTDANLTNTDFSGCRLRSTDFGKAIMVNAKFVGASMRWTFLKEADLRGADFTGADLFFSTMRETDARGAIFVDASLRGASLNKIIIDEDAAVVRKLWSGTQLNNAVIEEETLSKIVQDNCPPGSFVGFKKVKGVGAASGALIAEIEIPADAKRVNSTSRQCRCDKAKVLSLTHLNGAPFEGEEAVGWIYQGITYRVGEMVSEKEFSDDRRTSQGKGIHFFLTREEAEKFGIQDEPE